MRANGKTIRQTELEFIYTATAPSTSAAGRTICRKAAERSRGIAKINKDLICLYNEYYRIGQAKAQMKIYKAAKDNIIAHIEKEVHRLFSEINKGAFNAQAKCPSLASLYNPDLYDNIIKK
jgi:hypothetical protein